MFLPEFTSTRMQRKASEVFEAAIKEPIVISRTANEGVVMMSKREYSRLVMNQKPSCDLMA
jgi:PHD/YefM family antitoxin component YafN of YafNO toxin-antitoxin module